MGSLLFGLLLAAGVGLPRPTPPRRASRQHPEGTGVQRLTISHSILATVDAPGDGID